MKTEIEQSFKVFMQERLEKLNMTDAPTALKMELIRYYAKINAYEVIERERFSGLIPRRYSVVAVDSEFTVDSGNNLEWTEDE